MSVLQQDVELLRKVPMFADIKRSQLKLLAYSSDVASFEPGEYIVKQGEAGDAAYVIMEGEAEASVSVGSSEITVADFSTGDVIGEIAIFCDVPRTATITAQTKVKTLKIGKDAFFSLMAQLPEFGIGMTRLLAQRHQRDLAGHFPRPPADDYPEKDTNAQSQSGDQSANCTPESDKPTGQVGSIN